MKQSSSLPNTICSRNPIFWLPACSLEFLYVFSSWKEFVSGLDVWSFFVPVEYYDSSFKLRDIFQNNVLPFSTPTRANKDTAIPMIILPSVRDFFFRTTHANQFCVTSAVLTRLVPQKLKKNKGVCGTSQNIK